MVAEQVAAERPGAGVKPRRKSARQLIAGLRRQLKADNTGWLAFLFEAVADWPLARETAFDREFVYLIDGEAFDWIALVERIMLEPTLNFPDDARNGLLGAPGFPDEMTETEFRRRIGVAKHRAYLNYYYGVTVEQALLVAVEDEIRKRRYSNGMLPSDSRSDDAYVHLYGDRPGALLQEFRRDRPDLAGNPGARLPRTTSMQQAIAFTYWLFKRRLKTADPARLASDTKKGLDQLWRMRAAQARRTRARARSAR